MKYTIRELTPDDAEAMIAYMKVLADEPDNGITYSSADEFAWTLEQEREIIQNFANAENALWIIAEAAGQIIGSLNLMGGKRVLKHTAGLAISVARDYRNRGIGTALLRFGIDWCAANPEIHRLELEVFMTNPRAIHVYEKLGFIREGVRRHAYYKEGKFLDGLIMAIVFNR